MGNSIKKIFGILVTETVELPYKTPQEAAEAEKLNKEIAGTGFRTFRAGTDWAFTKFSDMNAHKLFGSALPPKHLPEPPKTLFKNGDLVKIFRTVSDGDVLWKGTVDYGHANNPRDIQKNLSAAQWVHMFYDSLPARLEVKSTGKVIYGALYPFSETGTEGTLWSVHEYGKTGYDGLNILKNGDKLTVYSVVRDGDIEWEGPVQFDDPNPSKVGWTEVMRRAKHMDTEKWLDLFYQNRPAVITPT